MSHYVLPLLLLGASLLAGPGQLVLVVADDMNRSDARLQRYALKHGKWEAVGKPIVTTLGRNGLAWGKGIATLPHPAGAPVKKEGDGRAPAGIFTLGPVFGYAARFDGKMPYLQATRDLVCVDDARSADYNRIRHIDASLEAGSFEWMRREDGLYRLGAVVHHNDAAVPNAGSCIFLHIWRGPGHPTAGCTAMDEKALSTVLHWLDPSKEPVLIQVPAASLDVVRERFRGIMEKTAP
jgi:D-alanyl-D-alanine dipeptidase